MGTIDFGALFVALPAMSRLFEKPPETVLLVVLIYTLTTAGFMLTAGRIGDTMGRERVFIMGLVIFTLGLTLNSMANGLWDLVCYRIVQGIGGAMLVGNSNAIVVSVFPDKEIGKVLGFLESIVGLGLMIGPVLGGVLVASMGWEAIFYLRIPLGLFAIGLAWFVFRSADRNFKSTGIDFMGAITLFIGLVSFIIIVNQGYRLGWVSPYILVLVGISAISIGLFLLIESRVSDPVVDLKLFRIPAFASYSSVLLTYFIPFGAIAFLLPFYLVDGLKYSELIAGLFLTVIPMLMFVFSPVTGIISDKVGSWPLTLSGMIFQLAGYLWMSRLGELSSPLAIVVGLIILGIGAGLFLTPTYRAVMRSTPNDRLGTASALIATTRTMGFSLGQAMTATIFAFRRDFHQSLALGFQDSILSLVAVTLVGLIIVACFARNRNKQI